MRRISLLILATLALALASVGAAVASQPDDHGPPNDPPCEQGDAGQHNPNCPDGPDDPEDPEDPEDPSQACPENALELDLDPLAYACVILLPAEDDTVSCPTGTIPLEVPADPLVIACVTVLVDDGGDSDDPVLDPGALDSGAVQGAAGALSL